MEPLSALRGGQARILKRPDGRAWKILAQRGWAAEVRFHREFRALRQARGPGLVRARHLLRFEGDLAFEMDWVEGLPLDQALAREGRKPARVRAVFGALLIPLVRMHRLGLVHCDLKPGNVLLAEGGAPVLLDLGLVVRAGELSLARQPGAGTVGYVAPEQVAGGAIGPAADVYALGVMLFEALAGRGPFLGTPEELLAARMLRPAPSLASLVTVREGADTVEPLGPGAETVDAELVDLVDRMLARDPRARPDGEELTRFFGVADDPGLVPVAGELQLPWLGAERIVRGVPRVPGELPRAILTGPAGSGRSRALHELARRVWDGVEVIRARVGEGLPLDGLLDHAPLRGGPALERSMRRPQWLGALVGQLVDRPGPVLILVDDVDEAQPDVVEVLRGVLALPMEELPAPVGVLLTARSGAGWDALPELPLEPLVLEELRPLLGPVRWIDHEPLLHRLLGASGGRPRALVQLMTLWERRGFLERDRSWWAPGRRSRAGEEAPGLGVSAALLPDGGRAALRTLAAWGGSGPLVLLQRTMNAPQELEELRELGLVRERGDEIELLVQIDPPADARERCRRGLESWGPERPGVARTFRARLLERAGDDEAASATWLQLGLQALQDEETHTARTALGHWRRLGGVALEGRIAGARCALLAGQGEAALDWLEGLRSVEARLLRAQALHLKRVPGAEQELTHVLQAVSAQRAKGTRAGEQGRSPADLGRASGTAGPAAADCRGAIEAEARYLQAQRALAHGDPAEAAAAFERAAQCWAQVGDERSSRLASGGRGYALLASGRAREARDVLLEVTRGLESDLRGLKMRSHLAATLYELCDLEGALSTYAEVARQQRELGDVKGMVFSAAALVSCRASSGRPLGDELHAAMRFVRRQRLAPLEAQLRIAMALHHCGEEEFTAADQETSWVLGTDGLPGQYHVMAQLLRSWALAGLGRYSEAVPLARKAVAGFPEGPRRSLHWEARVVAAAVAAQAGRPRLAARYQREARRRCRAFVEATAPLLAEAVGFERFVSFPRYLASVEEALDPASVAGLWARYSRVSSPPSSV